MIAGPVSRAENCCYLDVRNISGNSVDCLRRLGKGMRVGKVSLDTGLDTLL